MSPNNRTSLSTREQSSSMNSDSSSPSIQEPSFIVHSPNVVYTDEHILSKYTYSGARVIRNPHSGHPMSVIPTETEYNFKVNRRVPKTG